MNKNSIEQNVFEIQIVKKWLQLFKKTKSNKPNHLTGGGGFFLCFVVSPAFVRRCDQWCVARGSCGVGRGGDV